MTLRSLVVGVFADHAAVVTHDGAQLQVRQLPYGPYGSAHVQGERRVRAVQAAPSAVSASPAIRTFGRSR